MSDRLLTGIISIVVIAVIGTLAWRAQQEAAPATSSAIEIATEEGEARSIQFKARIEACRREGEGKTIAEGYIENIGNDDMRFATLQILWLNRVGEVIEANEIYVLRDEILPPGARKSFFSTTDNRVAVSCNVKKIDWW